MPAPAPTVPRCVSERTCCYTLRPTVPRLPAAEHAPEHLHINMCHGEKDRKSLHTDDTTTVTLCNHLLRSLFIAQECATSVAGHQAVKVLDGRCAPTRLEDGYRAQFP